MSGAAPASVSQALGRFFAETPFDAIPAAVVGRAKASLLHNLMLARLGAGLFDWPARWAAAADPCDGAATLFLPGGGRGGVDLAAIVNAAAMHAGSQDDIHTGSTSHPGVVTLPPALALAEQRGTTGAALLAALVMGYEAIGRIGRDNDRLATARGIRSSCLVGPFGPAVACGRLLGLDAAGMAAAIGLAANQAGGLAQTFREGTTEWQIQLSFAARDGLAAARAAAAGVPAAPHSLEGAAGLLAAYLGTTDSAAAMVDGLGARWAFDGVTIKAFPCCAILQGPSRSLIGLAQAHDLAAGAVARIDLHLAPFEAGYPGTDNPGPYATMTATTMSAQFNLGLGLVERRVLLADMFRFDDAAIAAAAAKVRVVADPALAIQQSRVRITLADGTVVERFAASGQEGVPSVDSVAADLAPAVRARWGDEARLEQLHAAVRDLDGAADVAALTRALAS